VSRIDGNESVMSDFEPLSDKDVEALLAGRETPGREAWARVIESIRQEATASVDSETARRHVSQAAQAAGSLPAPSPVRSRRSAAWRRRTVFAGLFSTLVGKIVIGAAAIAAATTGADVANILPEPVDNFIERNFIGHDELDDVEAQIRERARIHQQLEGEETQTQYQNQQGPGNDDATQNQHQQGPGNEDATQNQHQQGQDQEGQQSQNQQGPGNEDATQNQHQQGQDQEGQQSQNQQGPGDQDATQTQCQTQSQSGDMDRIRLGDRTQLQRGLDG
jgi:hypothetical protein